VHFFIISPLSFRAENNPDHVCALGDRYVTLWYQRIFSGLLVMGNVTLWYQSHAGIFFLMVSDDFFNDDAQERVLGMLHSFPRKSLTSTHKGKVSRSGQQIFSNHFLILKSQQALSLLRVHNKFKHTTRTL
jgi:hypothetical protein